MVSHLGVPNESLVDLARLGPNHGSPNLVWTSASFLLPPPPPPPPDRNVNVLQAKTQLSSSSSV